MRTFPKGCKVLVRDPVNRIDKRSARVVRQATQGIDNFVRVKYPGKSTEFDVRWKDVIQIDASKPLSIKPKPALSKSITVSETIVISDDEEPINLPLLDVVPPPVQASSTREHPTQLERRKNHEHNEETVRYFGDESQVIPDPDLGDGTQMRTYHGINVPGGDELSRMGEPENDCIDDHSQGAHNVHVANLYESYPARGDCQYWPGRNYDDRYVQDSYHPRMAHDRNRNDVSSDVIIQRDANGNRAPRPLYLRDDYSPAHGSPSTWRTPARTHSNYHRNSVSQGYEISQLSAEQQFHPEVTEWVPYRAPPQTGIRRFHLDSHEPTSDRLRSWQGPTRHPTGHSKTLARSSSDIGCSPHLRGDDATLAYSDDFQRSHRKSFDDRRSFYLRKEPAKLDNRKKLPARHPDLTVLSIPVPRAKRRMSEREIPSSATIGKAALEAAKDQSSLSPSRSLQTPPPLHTLSNSIRRPTTAKRIRVVDDFEERDNRNVSTPIYEQDLSRPVQPSEPPRNNVSMSISSADISLLTKAYSRLPLESLSDIAPSFKALNPVISTAVAETDKVMSKIASEVIMDEETLIRLGNLGVLESDPEPERFPPCRRKKSTPVKRIINGSSKEATLFFNGRNDKNSRIFITDLDTDLSNNNFTEKLLVHSCLCGLAEEPEIDGLCGSIQCGMCGLWSHLRCTQLLESEINQYKNRERRFLCLSCVDNIILYGQGLPSDGKGQMWGIQTRPVLPISANFGTNWVINRLSSRKRSVRKPLTEKERKARAENIEALREGVLRWSVGTAERNVVDKAVARESLISLLP